MGPEAKNAPSSRRERIGIALVARDVSFDLLGPILRVRSGLPVMRWAPVPEAAVDEDRELGFTEDVASTLDRYSASGLN